MALKIRFKTPLPLGLLALACALPVQAVEDGGVNIDDTLPLGGKELKLNGAGLRVKFIINVYAMGLYVTDKKTTPAEIQALDGPKRVALTMLREVNSDELGTLFITAINANTDADEKARYATQTAKFGEKFASLGKVKKGDLVTLDWLPGTGTVCSVNGKPLGDALPDAGFYSAILRIWLGDNPADSSLKPLLLGGK